MRSYSRRIIKAEEVAFLHPEARLPSDGSPERPAAPPERSVDPEAVRAVRAREAELVRQQAHAEGLAEGILLGKEQQKREHRQPLEALTALLAETARLREALLARAEGEVVALALAVAARVIHQEVSTRPEVVQGVLREAIRQIADRDQMKIRIHPEDFRTMMAIKSDFLQTLDGVRNVVFEADPAIARGGALIETLYGEVDARIDQQFEQLRSLLQSSAGGEAPAP